MKQGNLIAICIGGALGFYLSLSQGIWKITNKIESLDKKVESIAISTSPKIRIENVFGSEAPEKFYEINNQRVYLEIDGKPVEEYWRGK